MKQKPLNLEEIEPLNLKDIEKNLPGIIKRAIFVVTKKEAIDLVPELVKENIKEIKQRIKSACNFYLRYKDNPELLIKEHPEYEAEFINSDFKLVRFPLPPMETAFFIELEDGELDKYNTWLFKLALNFKEEKCQK